MCQIIQHCSLHLHNTSNSVIRVMATSGGDEGQNNPALDPDLDAPDDPDHEFAEFGSGCFWGAELAFQRVVGVVKTEVGYTQGHTPDPNYKLVCTGTTNHVEVVRVQFDPKVCPYNDLLALFWSRHDPTSINRQVPKLPQYSHYLRELLYHVYG